MLLDLGFVTLLALWSLVVGTGVLRLVDRGQGNRWEDAALAVPLGLGVLALGTLALGEVGSLGRSGLAIITTAAPLLVCGNGINVCWLWVARTTCCPGRGATRGAETQAGLAEAAIEPNLVWLRHRDNKLSRPPGPSYEVLEVNSKTERWPVDGAMLGLLIVGLLSTLLTALAPVTDGDALCYHLQVPKVFLASGSVGFDPDLHETVYPLLTEMLDLVALAFRGPVACRLVQWLLGLVFAANVTALARPLLGSRAWWAGTIALLVPAVSNGMGAPLNDVSLAAFGTAAIAGWCRWQDRPCAGTALLCGILAGLALGVKYPALVLAGLLGAAVFGRSLARRGDRGFLRARSPALFAIGLIACGGAWYLRAWIHTGNPVYPFFRHVFGGAGLDEVLDPARKVMAVTWWNVLTALVPMTIQPQRFDSFSHQFGPIFLLFLPALVMEKPPRRLLVLVAFAYAFLTLCMTQRQSTRFVLIAVGPMAVGAAWLAAVWAERRTWPSRVLVAALLLGLSLEAGIAVARTRNVASVVLGREPAAAFLARREPTYEVGQWVARNLPQTAWIVGQDHRGFYFPCRYTMELAHRRRTALGRSGEPAGELVARLQSEGFTHVLLCPPIPVTAVEFDPTLGRLLKPWLDARRPVYARTLTDADGIARRYAIYTLEPAARLADRSAVRTAR